jgi:hypothetical protein
MKKHSLSFELEGYLRKKGTWVHISELEDFGRSLGFLSSNVDRRLRELRKAGKIQSELRNFEGTKTTWWRDIQQFNYFSSYTGKVISFLP